MSDVIHEKKQILKILRLWDLRSLQQFYKKKNKLKIIFFGILRKYWKKNYFGESPYKKIKKILDKYFWKNPRKLFFEKSTLMGEKKVKKNYLKILSKIYVISCGRPLEKNSYKIVDFQRKKKNIFQELIFLISFNLQLLLIYETLRHRQSLRQSYWLFE